MKMAADHRQTNASPSSSEQESTALVNFVEEAIQFYLKFGGSLVTEEQYQERVAICKACPKFGKVSIILINGVAQTDGCTECGCPTATKPRAYKYFSFYKPGMVKAECPEQLWPVISEPKK